MRRTRLFASLVAMLCPIATAVAQGGPSPAPAGTARITGTVTENKARQPLSNVTVFVVGTSTGTRTGTDGKYTIAGLAAGRYRVRATMIGFAPLEDTVTVLEGQVATQNFELAQVAVTLQTQVVVGYGTQKRSDIAGAQTSITPNVSQTPTTSLEQALQGAAPGVQVTQASSAPGGGISIRVRGGSSVSGNNEPLYVVDGFPIENDPSAGDPTSGGRTNTAPSNPLAALNPSDIASIEILKDASATAIYGARGANGVVIITTKSGQAGRPKVTLDTYTGVQSAAKRYDLLNASEFVQFSNDWATAQSLAIPFPDSVLAKTPLASTDWQDVIFRNAPIRNAQLSVSGGTSGGNATRFSLSGGVFNQEGVVLGSDFRRTSLRGNVDQTVAEKLRLGTNLFVSRVNSSQVPTDGTFNAGAGAVGAALQYIPILPVRNPDGSYTLLQNDFPTALSSLGAGTSNVPNPLSMALDVQDRLGDTRMLANAFGEYELLDGLKLRVSGGADLSDRTRDTYYPRTVLAGIASNGRAIRGRTENTSFLNENTLTYAKTFGVHDLNLLAGYTRQMQNSVRTNMNNSNYVSDITGYENIGAGSQAGGPGVGSGRTRWTLASYLGRINYTLAGRYVFSVTGREDGSSRFGANHRWGFFPAYAAAWKISEEPFMRRFSSIEQLKLRGSWGVAGNPSIQPYQSMTRLSAQQYTFNGILSPGYYPSSIGNDELSWESTEQTNVGLDLTLFRGRMDFSADVYDKVTRDLLLGIDLPSESGYSTALVNAGAIGNKGVELSLTLRPFVTGPENSGFGWTSTFNFARNRNKVLDLGGVNRIFASSSIAPDLGTAGTIVQVGQPLGVFYGYKTSGIFRNAQEVADYTRYTRLASGGISPGQVRIVDLSGAVDGGPDGIIDANDRTIIGSPLPDWTGGWQNSLSWKGFELSGLMDASVGADVLNLNLYRAYGASPGTNISRERYYDSWTPTRTDTKYPRIGSTPVAIGADFTDVILEDGSYVRLRSATLSHGIPKQLFRGVLSSGRVYVTGQNLKTWSKYSGFNPDVSSQGVGNVNRGIDLGSYPLARTYTFGVNLSY